VTTSANRSGIDALLAVEPVWSGLVAAASVVGREGRWLLHAGPALADPCNPPAPVLSSAVLACRHEGWAGSADAAERMVRTGRVALVPAQPHRCVTPLAALISPGTSMVRVSDRAGRVPPVHAPLTTFGGPDLRFGTRDPAILERLRLRDGEWTARLNPALAEPIDLLAIAAEGIARGDDLHNRTTGATQALAERLEKRLEIARSPSDALMRGLAATPLFFLTPWMAAARLMLSAAEHREPGTLITSMAGNGEVFAVAVARRPQAWTALPARAPQGLRFDPASSALSALGAIGDSAVIDALGFGGQALAFAPEPRAALEPYLPADSTPCVLLEADHPAFAGVGVRVGLDAARIAASPALPVVTLGMVERNGERGLLGRGVVLPERDLFANAAREAS
jgi:hypothetical protein